MPERKRQPVSRIRVRAVIGRPSDGEEIRRGPVQVAGTAWSDSSPIERVEVSFDGERSWRRAELQNVDSLYAATPWRLEWNAEAPGPYTIAARATDGTGNTQPPEPVWNALGYGNNVVQRVRVRITA